MSRCTHRGTNQTLAAVTSSGLDVLLETAPLTPLDELREAMAGRATYTRHLGSGQIDYRTPQVIRSRPAGQTPRQDVLGTHRCTTGEQ